MAKKMQRVIFTGLLSFFLVLVIAFTPIFVSNAATNLDGEPYQGLLQLIGPNPIVYCKFSSYKAEIGDFYRTTLLFFGSGDCFGAGLWILCSWR